MMNKINYSLLLLAVLIGVSTFFSCNSVNDNNKDSVRWKAQHVIFIGLDGWGSYSVEKGNTPNIKQLMAEGTYTLQKRTVLPSSSAVNWASMWMGAGPELHGYTRWGSQKPDLPPREVNHNGMFPNIFTMLRDAAPDAEIGMLYEWDGIKYLVDTLSINHYSEASTENGNLTLRDMSVNYIKEKKPTFVGIIFDSPDDVGHKAGHDTPEYYEKMRELDGYVGEIIAVAKESAIYDNTIFIVTSDHGGIDKGHGGIKMEEMETPFIIAGKGIKKGGEFHESMMQYDIAPTIAEIFGLDCPQVWVGKSMSQVFN